MSKRQIDLHYFHYYLDRPRPHQLRLRYYMAPFRAQELHKSLEKLGIRCRVERINCLTLDTLEAVAEFLMRLSPSLVLQQALEELVAADRAIVMGKKAEPLQLTRRYQAISAVLALIPANSPERMAFIRKRRPKKTTLSERQLTIRFDNTGAQ